mmetsp:Transcript_11761/g.26246  ORF Transcript_11761/g.26246 Transcript_11761/m.26246 type:complete len:85 (-) Transcript_11761:204-458(-)
MGPGSSAPGLTATVGRASAAQALATAVEGENVQLLPAHAELPWVASAGAAGMAAGTLAAVAAEPAELAAATRSAAAEVRSYGSG